MSGAGYQDIPRLYTAIAESSACAIYWLILPRKVRSRMMYSILTILFFLADALWLELTDDVPVTFWLPCMLAAFGLMYVYLSLVLKDSAKGHLYTTLKALLLAEFMASLEWQIDSYLRSIAVLSPARMVLLPILVYGAVLLIFFKAEKGMFARNVPLELTWKELFATILVVAASFLFSNLSFVFTNTPFSSRLITDIFNIRTLVDLAGLAFMFALQSRAMDIAAEKELSAINSMLKAQYDHYRNYQETINLINIKYHDLKHQLAGLRAVSDTQQRNEWIDSMSRELESYRPDTQTGNQVLDGILDQKMPLVRNNRIQLTCVVDGKLLNFMHVTDICTIFGNALDNAIENVVTIQDPEKRLIHMSVTAKKQFLWIEVDDYCDKKLEFENGMPRTTKTDHRENHGFGVKSIAYTARKYGGNVSFGLNNNMFEMKMILPLPKDSGS